MQEQLEEIGESQVLLDLKIKENDVILEFKNFKLKILPETYEDFRFFVGQEYKKCYLEQVIFINDKNRVIKFIFAKCSKYNYCESELRHKVIKKFDDVSIDAIDAAIAELKKREFINDTNYVKQYVDYFNSSYYGKYYITNYFAAKKIDQSIIDKLVFDEDEENKKAEQYFNLIKNKYVSNNFARQKKKIYDALLKHGFGNDVATTLVSSLSINQEKEKKLLIKEYFKAKKKYNDKVRNEKEITDRIISYLVNRGYNYESIVELIDLDKRGELKDD